MKRINDSLINQVSGDAKRSPRRRKNYNFHTDLADPFQRLVNAIEPYSYIQPHKHENPDKRELFFALRGRFLLIEFDENGNITEHCILDPLNGCYGAEIPARSFHTFISLDKDAVSFECKDGPYDPSDDKNFAIWAPKEGEAGTREYLDLLLEKVGVGIEL